MKTPEETALLLKTTEDELAALIASHEETWAKRKEQLKKLADAHTSLQQQMQNEGEQNQLKVTHLEGKIAAYKDLLVEPEPTPEVPVVAPI